jgi:UDP-N-acetylglucosamine 2-epimerase
MLKVLIIIGTHPETIKMVLLISELQSHRKRNSCIRDL